MAINALLSTWTVFDETTKKLVWEEGKTTVDVMERSECSIDSVQYLHVK